MIGPTLRSRVGPIAFRRGLPAVQRAADAADL